MRYVSVTDAERGVAEVLDAAQREPVTLQRQKRDVAAVPSIAEYKKLTGLNVDEFQRFCDLVGERAIACGLTEEMLSDLLVDS